MKRLALAISLITSVALLSGCIIVPHRHGGHRSHGHHYSDGGGYSQGGSHGGGGRVYGPRR